ncbi:uncharacterized protein LOC124278183 [Haliotis rubra]|uniref:uncharacterized protein LOC124278183 n=1 Tax=Haliotis rubra TaxID=36100 RepID=UPI001EE517FD|nr:uncharacterized protein LOC124278183 [Haliotis rubra]
MPPTGYTSLSMISAGPRKTREELIREYYTAGFTQIEICALLYLRHGINLSIRHLNRIMTQRSIRRHVHMEELVAAVQYELSESGAYLGCRSMSRRLLSRHNIQASRDAVLQIQHELDPEGVQLRRYHRLSRRVYRNAGPNFLIHLDGYDKLKPYGFAIHGCMDGYSRRILWLRVSNTNNDPGVIASYFLDYLKEIQGVPRCIKMDEGTENGVVENIQKAFRWFHGDERCGDRSVITGSSHTNQRIERWWRTQRCGGIAYWIDLFKDKVQEGCVITSNRLHIECLRFCFTDLIQEELNHISIDWNQHRVRRMRIAESPHGKPDIMFFMPEVYGTHDYKFPASVDDIRAAELLTTTRPLDRGCSPEFNNLCRVLIHQFGRHMPQTAHEGLELYNWLLQKLGN